MAPRLTFILLTVALAIAGCGGGGDRDPSRPGAEDGEPGPGATGDAPEPVEGRFAVDGGRKLYLRCAGGGGGGPTVVYLHPYVTDESRTGSGDAGYLPDLLEDRHRFCVYDRANVGRSRGVPGRQTGLDAVRDLHLLLAAARVDGPYVLLGSEFGGLLATMYAATHPEEVAGMVLVDARLPGDLDIEERFFPAHLRPRPGAWAHTVERLDLLATHAQARRLTGDEPPVPLTFVGPEELLLPIGIDERRVTAVIRDMQATFVERFDPGRLVLLDSARPMEAVVPDRIAQEVDRVVEAAREAAEDASSRAP